jgi:hypothetical protein
MHDTATSWFALDRRRGLRSRQLRDRAERVSESWGDVVPPALGWPPRKWAREGLAAAADAAT